MSSKKSRPGGGKHPNSPRYSDRYGAGHINPYLGAQPGQSSFIREMEERQQTARRQSEQEAARRAAEAAEAARREEERRREAEAALAAQQRTRVTAEAVRGNERRRNREEENQPRAMRDPKMKERLRQIQERAVREAKSLARGDEADFGDIDFVEQPADVRLRLSDDNQPLVALETEDSEGRKQISWVPVVLSEKEMEAFFPAFEPAQESKGNTLQEEIRTPDVEESASEEELVLVPITGNEDNNAPEIIPAAVLETETQDDRPGKENNSSEQTGDTPDETPSAPVPAVAAGDGLGALLEALPSIAVEPEEEEPEEIPAAVGFIAVGMDAGDSEPEEEETPAGEEAPAEEEVSVEKETEAVAVSDEEDATAEETPAEEETPPEEEPVPQEEAAAEERPEVPVIAYEPVEDEEADEEESARQPEEESGEEETAEPDEEPQEESDADSSAAEEESPSEDEEESEDAAGGDGSPSEDQEEGDAEQSDEETSDEADESSDDADESSDESEEGDGDSADTPEESEEAPQRPRHNRRRARPTDVQVPADLLTSEEKPEESEPEEEEENRRTAVVPFGTDSGLSEYDSEDMLFVRRERTAPVSAYAMPNGGRLPKYINDDEFVERWLGDEEDEEDLATQKKRRRRRISAIVGAAGLVLALVGIVAITKWGIGLLGELTGSESQKEVYGEFISPVVMSEVPVFETWEAIPQDKLLQSAVFSLLVDMDVTYERDDTGKFIVPSNDVVNAVKELYGARSDDPIEDEQINTRIRNALYGSAGEDTTNEDAYYVDSEDSFHVADGLSGPSPEVIDISRRDKTVTLTVEYLEDLEIGSGGTLYSRQFVLTLTDAGYYVQAVREAEE